MHASKDRRAEIEAHFATQAKACAALGSPFTALMCRAFPAALPDGTRFAAKVRDWPGAATPDALALRVCGALHALARSGRAAELRAAYPPQSRGDPVAAAVAAIRAHDDWLLGWLDSAPQTNEAARSAVLLGAALHLAARVNMPLETLEIGASAGLNMGFDRYRYDLGEGRGWGDSASPVSIQSDWRGAIPPLDAPLTIAARAGVDLRPADPGDAAARARMLAYVWPDQAARLARAEAALDLAAAAPWRVEPGDAADWLEARLAAPRTPGRARALLHSIVWQYLPDAGQARISAAMARAGAAATPATPLAWLRMEFDGRQDSAAATLQIWPGPAGGGAPPTLALGRVDFHGRWADWSAVG